MNYIDILLLLPLAYGIIRGLMRGFVREVTSLLALLVGLFIAFHYADDVALWLQQYMEVSAVWLNILAYLIIFLGIGLLFSLVGVIITKALTFLALGIVNRILGGIFGFVKVLLIMLLLIFLFQPYLFQIEENSSSLQESEVYPYFKEYSFLSGQLMTQVIDEGEAVDSTLEVPDSLYSR